MSRLRDGAVNVVVVGRPRRAPLVYFDPSDGPAALAASEVARALRARLCVDCPGTSGLPPAASGLRPVSGVVSSRLDFIIPGILATAIMWLGIFAAIPLVQQREQQVLRRFAVTPVPRSRIVLAQVAGRLLVSLGQGIVVLAAARLLFGVPLGSALGVDRRFDRDYRRPGAAWRACLCRPRLRRRRAQRYPIFRPRLGADPEHAHAGAGRRLLPGLAHAWVLKPLVAVLPLTTLPTPCVRPP